MISVSPSLRCLSRLSPLAAACVVGLAVATPTLAVDGDPVANPQNAVVQESPAESVESAEPQQAAESPANAESSAGADKAADAESPADADKAGEGGASDPAKWVELFDGQTLDGWIQRGGRAKFFAQRGELVGATRLATADSFLCTAKTYGNFELELEFKIDPLVNSGIQFRSRSDSDHEGGAVYGYQAEIDPSERSWTGGIYDQSRRGWLVTLEKQPEARAAFKPDQWNRLRIQARGPHIATWVNDVPAAELEDDMTTEGFIALQVHRTDLAESREVRWRNIRLRPLPQ